VFSRKGLDSTKKSMIVGETLLFKAYIIASSHQGKGSTLHLQEAVEEDKTAITSLVNCLGTPRIFSAGYLISIQQEELPSRKVLSKKGNNVCTIFSTRANTPIFTKRSRMGELCKGDSYHLLSIFP